MRTSPIARARLALDGLSVGDSFGHEVFLAVAAGERILATRSLPAPLWNWSDDSEQASAIVEVLSRHGRIDQDSLASSLGARYMARPGRGYAGSATVLLDAIARGVPWQQVSRAVFNGQGSLGNGAAMRVAPLGAFFADDLEAVVTQARLSAEVTHAHPEAQAGAIAVALAAAWAWNQKTRSRRTPGGELLDFVYRHMPAGETRTGIGMASVLPMAASVPRAVLDLGNGCRARASDTVPFALWCAARHIEDFEDALWSTAAGLGDVDTTCAIVGAIVALRAGAVPAQWLRAREPLQLGGDR